MSVKQIFNTSAELDYPTVLPTLDLDFANSKTLDPRITFTRSSGGSYVGADGLIKLAGVNEARFDHNPETGESLGLLVEEVRTNNINYSNNFNMGTWVLPPMPNAGQAPDGTYSAWLLNASYVTYAAFTAVDGYTTIFVKRISARYAFLGGNNNTYPGYLFDLDAGTAVAARGNNPAGTLPTITPVGNGWYRIGVKTTLVNITIACSNSSDVAIQNGPFEGQILIWGAQVEAGAFPTSYIPTVASTVTRAADVASITGANFSSWYRQDEGTVLITQRNDPADLTGTVLEIGGTTGNYALGHTAHNIGFANATALDTRSYFFGLGTPSAFFYGNRTSPGTIAYAYKQSNYGLSTGGNNVPIVAGPWNQLVPVVDSYLGLGRIRNGASTTQLHVSRLAYWPTRLPDAQLQALTT